MGGRVEPPQVNESDVGLLLGYDAAGHVERGPVSQISPADRGHVLLRLSGPARTVVYPRREHVLEVLEFLRTAVSTISPNAGLPRLAGRALEERGRERHRVHAGRGG